MSAMQAFRFESVKLHNSLWQKQLDDTMELYLNIPNDSLLHNFRKRKGLPAPGRTLTGWYGRGPHNFGQIVGALAKFYKLTGRPEFREKVYTLLNEWKKTIDENGFALYPDGNNSTYMFDKTLGGLMDAYEFADYKEALPLAKKISEWASQVFKRDIKWDGDQDKALVEANMIEWYTLPEHLYRAYQFSQDPFFKEFAEVWTYRHLWDQLAEGFEKMQPRHAYSQVNSLSSAAQAYLATGDDYYLRVIENGYDIITDRHIFATGGYGPAETLFGEEGYLGDSLKSIWDRNDYKKKYKSFARIDYRDDTWGSCEVPCCTWAVFKLSQYLLSLTGKAKYGDWAEKLLYNGVGAELPMKPNGKIQYYTSYFINGAVKSVEDRRYSDRGIVHDWVCCTGTFPHDVAEYSNLLYYQHDKGLSVCQYLPSSVHFKPEGQPVVVENLSSYPEQDELRFSIQTEKPVSFELRFRVPAWLRQTAEVKINGQDVVCDAKANEWLSLERTWQADDVVFIKFPFELYFTPIDKENPHIAALCYGPLTLAGDELAMYQGDMSQPENWIKRVSDDELVFETLPGHDRAYDFVTHRFRPLHQVPEMKWYYVYNRVHPVE